MLFRSQTGTGALVSLGIGLLGARSVSSLLASTAVVGMLILIVGRAAIGETIENEESETVLLH